MDVFVARQPIFDRSFRVFGYELLFRQSTENFYNAIDGDQATSSVITNSLWVIGLEHLTNNRQVFVNITEKILREETLSILPPVQVVLEILETIDPTDEIIAKCKELKRKNFMLALDDFVFHSRFQSLVELADIIKIDVLATPYLLQKELIQRYTNTKIKYLAEKVETYEQYEQALTLGYSYFQGYFFSKPVVVSGKDIPTSKLTVLKIIKDMNRDDLDIKRLKEIIQKDVSLSYKLLKFINSATFGFKLKIASIEQALVLLGQRETMKWLCLVAAREIAKGKPNELLLISVVRARFSELVACETGVTPKAAEAFTMGLFSLVDALLDRDIAVILKQLPVTDEISDALLGRDNRLHDILQLARACEKGNWADIQRYGNKMKLPLKVISSLYMEALKWAYENE